MGTTLGETRFLGKHRFFRELLHTKKTTIPGSDELVLEGCSCLRTMHLSIPSLSLVNNKESPSTQQQVMENDDSNDGYLQGETKASLPHRPCSLSAPSASPASSPLQHHS